MASWIHLAEYTLVHLALFNRKRPGETQRILVNDYRNYKIIQDDDLSEEFDTLAEEQIKMGEDRIYRKTWKK